MRNVYKIGVRTTLSNILAVFALVLGSNLLSANDSVGERIEIRIEDLDRPYETPSASNGPVVIERPPEATLKMPEGFEFNVFSESLNSPRWMTVAENGDVFLTERNSDNVLLLRDSDKDGVADIQSVYISGLEQPHGLAFHDGYLYIGEVTQVRRVPYEDGALEAPGPIETVTAPGTLGDVGGHWTRNIAFGPDGKHLYVAVGSRSNRNIESPPRATVQRFSVDGSDQTTFASGLRNPVGIAFNPGSTDLYVVVNERDGLGDGLVPDYFTRVEEGGFYGWPFTYLGRFVDPKFEEQDPSLLARSLEPDVLFESHSAPLGLVFYDADQFPEEYFGDAFVAFHGSWNAAKPTGYKIVRIPFENGLPVPYYENFAVGFNLGHASLFDTLSSGKGLKSIYRQMKSWFEEGQAAQVWGRPVGLAIAKDGSLLVADDAAGAIWRISYKDRTTQQ